MRHKHRHRRFSELSQSKRSAEGFKVRQRIARDRELYGGRFTSDALLLEPEKPVICNQWFDFTFTGPHKYEVWNADIVTARQSFWDEVESLAFDRAWDLLSAEERTEESRRDKVPDKRDAAGKVLTYRWAPKVPIQYPQFGGLTFHNYCLQLEREIITTEPPEIYERFRPDRSYYYGIGLHIVIDAEAISYPLIAQTIERFLNLGQKAWKSDKPVARKRLPFETETDTMKAGRALFSSLPLRSYK